MSSIKEKIAQRKKFLSGLKSPPPPKKEEFQVFVFDEPKLPRKLRIIAKRTV